MCLGPGRGAETTRPDPPRGDRSAPMSFGAGGVGGSVGRLPEPASGSGRKKASASVGRSIPVVEVGALARRLA
jgi:hypothetical protein